MDLPKVLGDGLVLRWASADDAAALAEFNFEMHNDNQGGVPELWLKAWTRDLMSGHHPTTRANDFTLVVDEQDTRRIVSSAVLIGQTWRYAGQHIGCGRPELIGTDANYRRQGLVRAQMALIHARSAERGDLVQAITGIPWFYRQFGYEMALDLGGGRRIELAKIPRLKGGKKERFKIRTAMVSDISRLHTLYEASCSDSLVSCCRDEVIWRHELTRSGLENIRYLHVIETPDDEIVGYVDFSGGPQFDAIRELVVDPSVSLRAAGQFVLRWLKQRLELNRSAAGAESNTRSASGITLRLGPAHPVYEALAPELGQNVPPYAWYVRVPDLPAFLLRVRPVLETRLEQSAMTGYSGLVRLNFYESQLTLLFDSGRLVKIGAYRPEHFFDADAFFPDHSFLQLLFGYRSVEEIHHIRPDCFIKQDSPEVDVLLKALFPKQRSQIVPVA